MGWQRRILEKFENSGGSVTVTFPLAEYEWESDQPLRTRIASVPGGHYGVDLIGNGPGFKDVGRERLRCQVIDITTPSTVDSLYDELRTDLWSVGRGKLFSIDNTNTRRWCWARIAAMPTMSWRAGMIYSQSLSLDFLRLSDWYGTTETDLTFTVNAATYNFNVTNSGNAPVYNAVIILKGTPFTNPVLTNNTNGYSFSTLRDGTASTHWLKIDAGRHTVEWSTNSGGAYADDYANYVRASGQAHLMVLQPGVNAMTLTGANGSTLDVNFYPANH